MQNLIKQRIKSLLESTNFWVSYSPQSRVGGYSLLRDLRLLINKEAPLCLDVGANRGQTIQFLQRAFKNPIIHAFEPSTQSFEYLQSGSYPLSIYFYNFALGAENTQDQFINYEASVLSSFLELEQNQRSLFKDVKIQNKEVVNIKTLDTFLQEIDIDKIDLLKVDTQGYDFNVLKGASDHLKDGSIDHVLIELNFNKIYQGQTDPYTISQFLLDHNFYLVDYYEKCHIETSLAWCTALFRRR